MSCGDWSQIICRTIEWRKNESSNAQPSSICCLSAGFDTCHWIGWTSSPFRIQLSSETLEFHSMLGLGLDFWIRENLRWEKARKLSKEDFRQTRNTFMLLVVHIAPFSLLVFCVITQIPFWQNSGTNNWWFTLCIMHVLDLKFFSDPANDNAWEEKLPTKA